MFNKEESNKIKKVKIDDKVKFKKIGYLLLTFSLILTLSETNDSIFEDSLLESHIKYETAKYNYIVRLSEYRKTKQYDEKVVNLYKNGSMLVDDKVYPLDGFYIMHDKEKNDNIHLICVGSGMTDILSGSTDKYDCNTITLFMDTTAFINMIESDCVIIKDNIITIKDKLKLKEIIDNWDGYIHDKVAETDAVKNKDRLGI